MPKAVVGDGIDKEARRIVLVVDDEPIVRNFMKRVLAGEGYNVLSATNGREALALVEVGAIDLVVTDIMMPELDGLKLGALISQLPLAPPVIYVSASDRPPAGMGDWYLQKPFSAADLIRMAGEILSRSNSS